MISESTWSRKKDCRLLLKHTIVTHIGIAKWRYHKKCVKSPGFKNSNISYKQVLDLTQGMSWLHFFLYVLCVSCLVQGDLFSSFPCARCVLLSKHALELTCRKHQSKPFNLPVSGGSTIKRATPIQSTQANNPSFCCSDWRHNRTRQFGGKSGRYGFGRCSWVLKFSIFAIKIY